MAEVISGFPLSLQPVSGEYFKFGHNCFLSCSSSLYRWIKKSFEFSFIKIFMPRGVRCHRGVLCIICGASWNTYWHLSVLQSAMEQKHFTSTGHSASVWTAGNHNVFCELGKSATKLL